MICLKTKLIKLALILLFLFTIMSFVNCTRRASSENPQVASSDSDGDGVLDDQDNCKTIANADQMDSDGNGVGDLCESGGEITINGAFPKEITYTSIILSITILGENNESDTFREKLDSPSQNISVTRASSPVSIPLTVSCNVLDANENLIFTGMGEFLAGKRDVAINFEEATESKAECDGVSIKEVESNPLTIKENGGKSQLIAKVENANNKSLSYSWLLDTASSLGLLQNQTSLNAEYIANYDIPQSKTVTIAFEVNSSGIFCKSKSVHIAVKSEGGDICSDFGISAEGGEADVVNLSLGQVYPFVLSCYESLGLNLTYLWYLNNNKIGETEEPSYTWQAPNELDDNVTSKEFTIKVEVIKGWETIATDTISVIVSTGERLNINSACDLVVRDEASITFEEDYATEKYTFTTSLQKIDANQEVEFEYVYTFKCKIDGTYSRECGMVEHTDPDTLANLPQRIWTPEDLIYDSKFKEIIPIVSIYPKDFVPGDKPCFKYESVPIKRMELLPDIAKIVVKTDIIRKSNNINIPIPEELDVENALQKYHRLPCVSIVTPRDVSTPFFDYDDDDDLLESGDFQFGMKIAETTPTASNEGDEETESDEDSDNNENYITTIASVEMWKSDEDEDNILGGANCGYGRSDDECYDSLHKWVSADNENFALNYMTVCYMGDDLIAVDTTDDLFYMYNENLSIDSGVIKNDGIFHNQTYLNGENVVCNYIVSPYEVLTKKFDLAEGDGDYRFGITNEIDNDGNYSLKIDYKDESDGDKSDLDEDSYAKYIRICYKNGFSELTSVSVASDEKMQNTPLVDTDDAAALTITSADTQSAPFTPASDCSAISSIKGIAMTPSEADDCEECKYGWGSQIANDGEVKGHVYKCDTDAGDDEEQCSKESPNNATFNVLSFCSKYKW